MKLILLRHGESQWNLENRFTGWKDVSLTNNGIKEAEFAAKAINQKKITIDSIYTSLLERAVETTKIVTKNIDFEFPEELQFDSFSIVQQTLLSKIVSK